MTHTLPAPDFKNLQNAYRAETAVMVDFVGGLTDAQWNAPSKAAGWSIADVVAHIGSTAHNMYIPAGVVSSRKPSLEAANEGPVEVRRSWSRERVMAEFTTSTRRAGRMLSLVRRTPLRNVPMKLNELGKYPMALLVGGALVFDLHTHLRHDMAPALGLPTPPSDGARMKAVLTWMTAVLSNQTALAPAPGLEAGLTLTLTGPGGGSWWIDSHGLSEPGTRTPAGRITAPAISLPDWGTQRSSWRDAEVSVEGDAGLAALYLNAVNII